MSISSKQSVKPLKGVSLNSNLANIGTINAGVLKGDSIELPNFEDGIIYNVIIEDSEIRNSIIGANGQNSAFFVNLQTTGDVAFLSNIPGASVSWDPDTGLFYITSDLKVGGCSFLGNIEICNNDIKASNLNGDININPNGLGTLYLNGPIYNKTTNGSFYTELANGGMTFLIDDNITLYSSHGSALIETFGDQNITAKNGDITLNVETTLGLSDLVSNVNMTDGTILITTTSKHYLTTGNIVNVSNTLLTGDYTVGNIINDTQFKITDTTLITSVASGGTYIKHISNNIILNSQNLIKIPENTKLTFGETCNSISSSTNGIYIKSCENIIFENPSNKIIEFPQTTKLQLGSSGNNYINFDGNTININSSSDITSNSNLLQLNNINTHFYDPILTIADYDLISNDNKDRGIEFNYYDTNTSSMKLGWFGYKNDTELFTFISDAVNTNEIITGTLGNFELNNLSVSNITLVSGSTLDMNCGRLLNANLITGCGNTLNIAGSDNVNISASGTISLIGTIYIPTNTNVKLGSQGSLLNETVGNILINSFKNIHLNTQTFGNITIPTNTKVSFDGTTNGNIIITSNTSGELILKTNNNLYLTTTNGNVIIPQNTNIQLGNTTQNIVGSTSGIILKSNSSNSFINIISDSTVNIYSSFGNILLNSNIGDINLITSTSGNTRINQKLIFGTTGFSNSINVNTISNFVISGNVINDLYTNDFTNIYFNASNTINIPNNVLLNIGSHTIYSTTQGNILNIKNNISSGSILIDGNVSTTLNNTGGNLVINNINTNISTNTFTISGNSASNLLVNTQNVLFKDPILTLGEIVVDNKDRGIEYNYGTNLGWFGKKSSTDRFTFYSNAINTNEVITGTIGDIQASNVYSSNLIFNGVSAGNIDMNCGIINNVNTLYGCSGTININATSTINQNSNNIMMNATEKIVVPYNIPLSFGNTSNGFICDSIGNLTIKSGTVIFDSNVLINGTTTNVNSVITNLQDPIFSIGGITGPIVDDNKDRGIEFKWTSGITTKTGFFGFKDNIERFVFIKDGTNTSEVYSGNYSDVQFNNSYLENIYLNNFGSGGNIYGINNLSGGEIRISTTSGNIYLTPTQGNSVSIPYNIPLIFGNTSNNISSDTSGNMMINSFNDTTITSNQFNIDTESDININENIHINIGNTDTYITNSNGTLQIFNSQGNIDLIPMYSSGNINIPSYNHLNFGINNTNNSIYSDNTNLIINGYQGIDFNSTSVTFNGDVNIIGSISATGIDFDFNKYILPLGTYQYLTINNISNVSGSNGNISITTTIPHNFIIGDVVVIKNSNAVPDIDNDVDEDYTITFIDSEYIFRIIVPTILTTDGDSGTVKSDLTTQQSKDVGIQVNYWSSTGNVGITSGTIGYKTGFFGFKKDTERWSFYTNSTISNDVVSGSFGDIDVNKVYTSKMSGFVLEGNVSCGSNSVNGTNFIIGGGSINSTPIGASSAQSGRFTTLNNTVTASLTDTTLQGTLIYPLTDRYVLSSGGITYRSPNSTNIVSMFSVSGVNFTSPSGTMPSTAIAEGTIKHLICTGMGNGCQYTVYFGSNKLITPNPTNNMHIPTKLVFKRKGQSAQLIFEGAAWVLLNGGVYIL